MSKTLEEIALQIGKEVFGAVDECLSGQGERDREVTAGEYPIGEGCIEFARRLVAALGAQEPTTILRDTTIHPGTKLYAAPVVNEGWQMVPKEHVCGLQGFGALDDVCPACESAAPEYGK